MKLNTFNNAGLGPLELSTSQHCLMNLPLVFKTNHPELNQLAQRSFARFTSYDPTQSAIELRLIAHDPPRSVLPPSPTLVYRNQAHLAWTSLDPWNTALLDYRQGLGFAFVTPEAIAQPHLVQEVFLWGMALPLVQVLGKLAVLHASAVVKQGQTLTLIGSSGSGKSTLAYACVRQGFKVVAEDAVFVEGSAGGLCYWGKPWPFRLLENSKPFFPELEQIPAVRWSNGKSKLALDIEALYPGSMLTCAQPGPLVFLQRSTHKPQLSAISKQEVEERLELIWHYDVPVPDNHPFIYKRLLDLPAYVLGVNGNPAVVVELLEQLIEAHV